jgi:hypothetical protein
MPTLGLDERFYALTYELDGRPNFTLRHRVGIGAALFGYALARFRATIGTMV